MLKDVAWAPYRDVVCETFILRQPVISSEYARHHGDYLISLSAAPHEASHVWHSQSWYLRHMADGFVSLRSGGIELMPVDFWGEVGGFWRCMMDVITDYAHTGSGHTLLEDQPYSLALRKAGDSAVFELADASYTVSPRGFVLGLLSGANDFYSWAVEHVGGFSDDETHRPALLRTLITNERAHPAG